MSYPSITPNFQVLYRGLRTFLVFVSEEPGCPGLSRHTVICDLHGDMLDAANAMVQAQETLQIIRRRRDSDRWSCLLAGAALCTVMVYWLRLWVEN